MKFSNLSKVFSEIESVSSRNIITQKLSEIFLQSTPGEAQIITYLSLGTLRPPYIQMQFNLAEKTVIKVVAQLLEEPIEKVELKLKDLGDLGELLKNLDNKISHELTLLDVYNKLTQIETISGQGSVNERSKELYNLLKEVDGLSAMYIIRIILGKLRLGFSDMTIIDSLSWMITGDKKLSDKIEDAYNVCADLGLIALTLKESGIEAIENFKPKLGIPIRPAAAERLPTPSAIIEKIGTCIAQPKLDGFRLQVHIQKNSSEHNGYKVWFFSRNLIDMSSMFPDLVDALRYLDIENVIFEGEAIGYDEATDSYTPFQETVKRKRKHDIESVAADLPLKLMLFDILYLNSKVLLNLPHYERREILLKLFHNYKDDRVSVIHEEKINNAQELEKYFLENISAGLEGLVIKKPDSVYKAGKRNFNWIKLKRHEQGHLEDTIDVVVLGYYNGSGKRASFGIGAFLVGIYNNGEDRFETVAKIGTGLKDFQWIELRTKCDNLKVQEKPHNVKCPKGLEPDIWVFPEIVVIVRADEITKSPLHSSGLALRFPRFVNYAPDKSATQATNINELERLFEDQKS